MEDENDEEDYNNLDLTDFIKFLNMCAERKLERILKKYKKEK